MTAIPARTVDHQCHNQGFKVLGLLNVTCAVWLSAHSSQSSVCTIRPTLRGGGPPFSVNHSAREPIQTDFKRRRVNSEPIGDVSKRTLLNTKYSEKDEVKALGARWDPALRKWYVPPDKTLSPFSKWLPPVTAEEDSLSQLSSDFQDQNSDSVLHKRARLALQVDTQMYVHPSAANRSKGFVCLECGQKVILKRGDIRESHFAHY